VLIPVIALLAVVGRGTPSLRDRGVRATGVPPGRLSRRYWVSWVVVTAGIAVEFCLALLQAMQGLRNKRGLRRLPSMHRRDDVLNVVDRTLERRFHPDGLKNLERNRGQVLELRCSPGRLSHLLNRRQEQPDEDCDDCDHDQKLDQSESP